METLLFGPILPSEPSWLNDDWQATAVGLAVTYLVFIMGIPALIFQTFIPDALRGIYNEKFEKNWWVFGFQIFLVLIIFMLSSPGPGRIALSYCSSDKWIAVVFIIVATIILVWGIIYLKGRFDSIRNIEQKLSKKILRGAIYSFRKYKKVDKKSIEYMIVLAKELPVGIKKGFFLEDCETLLERLMLKPAKDRDIKLIGEILENVVCLSVTYNKDQFNHDNIEKVMAILNLVYNQAYLNNGNKLENSGPITKIIANCIKEIAINAMFKNDLRVVMVAIENLLVIEATHNELYALGNEALQHQYVPTAVMAVQKMKGKLINNLDGIGIQNNNDKRLFIVWVGLVAKINELGDAAKDFSESQAKLVIKYLPNDQADEIHALFADTRKHFYQQAEFATIDAVNTLERNLYPNQN